MGNKVLIPVILILLAAAIVLGWYTIGKQQQRTGIQAESSQAQGGAIGDEFSMSLEEKEQFVLNPPSREDASTVERDFHLRIAQSIAQAAPYLNITNCSAGRPVVFQVQEGKEFTVKNDDSVDHNISLGGPSDSQIFLIPASSATTILPEFDKGPGVYGYGCDGSAKEVGLILVVP